MKTLTIAISLGLLALAGCETGPSRQQVVAALVGRTEADAIRTLGAPSHIIEANGHQFLAYDDQRIGYAPAPFIAPYGPFGFGYIGAPSVAVVRGCQTTLDVAGGRVLSFTLRGNDC